MEFNKFPPEAYAENGWVISGEDRYRLRPDGLTFGRHNMMHLEMMTMIQSHLLVICQRPRVICRSASLHQPGGELLLSQA